MNKWHIIEDKLDEKIIKSFTVQNLSECISTLEKIKDEYGDIQICKVVTVNPKLNINLHKMGETNIVVIE